MYREWCPLLALHLLKIKQEVHKSNKNLVECLFGPIDFEISAQVLAAKLVAHESFWRTLHFQTIIRYPTFYSFCSLIQILPVVPKATSAVWNSEKAWTLTSDKPPFRGSLLYSTSVFILFLHLQTLVLPITECIWEIWRLFDGHNRRCLTKRKSITIFQW